jgi:glutathione synthase/RimK-type ligase-like ATP-grasp enzyme
MIVFFGIPSEDPMALAIAAANQEGIDHLVVNQRDAAKVEADIRLEDGLWTGWIGTSGCEVAVDDISGIYARMAEISTVPDRMGTSHQDHRRSLATQHALSDWVETASCRVANRAAAMSSNSSKPYQAQLIRRAGFRTPRTLVTTDPASVARFAREHPAVIYKSVSAARSIVRTLDLSRGDDLDRVRSLPTQFQERIEGVDIRVHVVGEEVFPIEIASEAVDYRYAARDNLEIDMRPITLPDVVTDRCRRLSHDLDLPFCGIDLRRTAQNEYVCFEVNPSPAYSYYEQITGQEISRGLVRYLSGIAA